MAIVNNPKASNPESQQGKSIWPPGSSAASAWLHSQGTEKSSGSEKEKGTKCLTPRGPVFRIYMEFFFFFTSLTLDMDFK